MDASLQFNIPAYASAVVSTDEIVAQLSARHPEATPAHQARSN
jgi:hypothetical protein